MNLERNIQNTDGTIDTLIISSNDNNSPLDMNKTYKLANYTSKKVNKLTTMYKNSILGSDIGINSKGFTHIAILSSIIAIASFCILYILFRI